MSRKFVMLMMLTLAACNQGLQNDSGTPSDANTPPVVTTDPNGNPVTAPASYTGPTVRILGRTTAASGGGTLLTWSGTGVETRFNGSSIAANLSLVGNQDTAFFDVFVDGALQTKSILVGSASAYTINAGSDGNHTVRLVKRTEAGLGQVVFSGFNQTALLPTLTPSSRRIEVIGDSISAGFGVLGFTSDTTNTCPTDTSNFYLQAPFEDSDEAYSNLLGTALNADVTTLAWSGKGVFRNDDGTTTQTIPDLYDYTDFTDPNQPAGLWSFDPNSAPAVVVVNLGTNDFSADRTANVSQTSFVNAYVTFVKHLRAKYPNAQIILTAGGPMLSDFYPSGLTQATTSVAYVTKVVQTLGDANVHMVQVATQDTNAGTGCLSHPLPATQQALSDQLAATIKSLMQW